MQNIQNMQNMQKTQNINNMNSLNMLTMNNPPFSSNINNNNLIMMNNPNNFCNNNPNINPNISPNLNVGINQSINPNINPNMPNLNMLNNLSKSINNINNSIPNTPMTRQSNNSFCSSLSEGLHMNVKNMENMDSPKNIIHLENILKSKDKRTTLIIRNIPNRYTINLLLQEINAKFCRKYDIVYLPKDYINNSNLGFGFINFIDHIHLLYFYDEFNGKKWNCFNSNKRCLLAYSKYQGKNELTKYIHKKLGISSHYNNNNENLKKSFCIMSNEDKYPRPSIEIPIKYYKAFMGYYPYALCHIKNDNLFVVDKYYNF